MFMKMAPTCPRCGGPVSEPSPWASGWHCPVHGEVHPFRSPYTPSADGLRGLLRGARVPVWLPCPLPAGWLVTGFAGAGSPDPRLHAPVGLAIGLLTGAVTATSIEAAAPQQTADRHGWATYVNVRFQYSICYPKDLLVPQGESDNSDGQKFLSNKDSAELAAGLGAGRGILADVRAPHGAPLAPPERRVTRSSDIAFADLAPLDLV